MSDKHSGFICGIGALLLPAAGSFIIYQHPDAVIHTMPITGQAIVVIVAMACILGGVACLVGGLVE